METITYKKNRGETHIRYDIAFDEEEILAFCEILKKEACATRHYDYKSTYGPLDHPIKRLNGENNEHFPAYTVSKYKKTIIMEPSNGNQKLLVPIYHFDYDVNYLPYLLSLLNDLLNGNASSIEEILYPNFEREFIPIRAEIQDKEEQYRNLNLQEKNIVERKLQVLKELEELLLKVKSGDYEIPIRKYYEEVQKLMTIKRTILPKDEEEDYKTR